MTVGGITLGKKLCMLGVLALALGFAFLFTFGSAISKDIVIELNLNRYRWEYSVILNKRRWKIFLVIFRTNPEQFGSFGS